MRCLDSLLKRLAGSSALLQPAGFPAGDELDYPEFITALEAALSYESLAGDDGDDAAGSGSPPVLILRLLETRGLRFEALALCGLAEGLVPAVERVDPFLSEEVRRRLGLEARLGQEQAWLFYPAAAAPANCLLSRVPPGRKRWEWKPPPSGMPCWGAGWRAGGSAPRAAPARGPPLAGELLFGPPAAAG